jgi:hypothetical protein
MGLPGHEAIPLESQGDLLLDLQRAMDTFAKNFNVEVAAPVDDEVKPAWAAECALGPNCVGLLEKLATHYGDHASMLNGLCKGGVDFDPAVAAKRCNAHGIDLQGLTSALNESAEAYESLVRSARNYLRALRVTVCGVPDPIDLGLPMLGVEGIRLVESQADRSVHGCRSLQALLEKRCADVAELPQRVQAKEEGLRDLKKFNTQIKLIQAKIVANSNRQHELRLLAEIASDDDVSDDEYRDPASHGDQEGVRRLTEAGIESKIQALRLRLSSRSEKMAVADDGGLEGQVCPPQLAR